MEAVILSRLQDAYDRDSSAAAAGVVLHDRLVFVQRRKSQPARLRQRGVWLFLLMFLHANFAPAEAHHHKSTASLIEHIEQHHHEDIAQHLGVSETSAELPGEFIAPNSLNHSAENTDAQHSGHWHAHIHEVFDAWDLSVVPQVVPPILKLRAYPLRLLKSQGYRFGPLRPPAAHS